MDAVEHSSNEEYANVIPRAPLGAVTLVHSGHKPRRYAGMRRKVIFYNVAQVWWDVIAFTNDLEAFEYLWFLEPEPVPSVVVGFFRGRTIPFRDSVKEADALCQLAKLCRG